MTPTSDSYQPPVSQLLEIGDPYEQRNTDYLALGLTPEHIPELIRMAQDAGLARDEGARAAKWAPVHARRALGRLRAEAAIAPLLGLLPQIENNDWIDDLSNVFGQIGPAALAPLEAYAASPKHPLHARGLAGEGLVAVGKLHPASRAAAVAALMRLLGNFAEPGRSPSLNGFLISNLVDLDAVEAAPLMQRAFTAGAVETDVIGDWQAVQVELGLKDERDAPRYPQSNRPAPAAFPKSGSRSSSPPAARSKAKAPPPAAKSTPKPPPPPKPAQSQPPQTASASSSSDAKRQRHRHKKK